MKSQKKRWNPEFYFENSSLQMKHAKELINKHSFSGSENILDIGCGDGKITAELSQLVPNGTILGIDKSPDMINFSRRQFSGTQFSNLKFDMLDACQIHWTKQFDLIASFSCLHFIKNGTQLQILTKIHQALKPGGQLLFMLYRKCPAQWHAINSVANHHRWNIYFNGFEPDFQEYLPEHYQKLLDQANLDRFNAIFTPTEYITYASKDMLSTFIRGWLPHIPMLPKELQNDFMDEVTTRYLDNLGVAQSEPIKIPFVRLLVY